MVMTTYPNESNRVLQQLDFEYGTDGKQLTAILTPHPQVANAVITGVVIEYSRPGLPTQMATIASSTPLADAVVAAYNYAQALSRYLKQPLTEIQLKTGETVNVVEVRQLTGAPMPINICM